MKPDLDEIKVSPAWYIVGFLCTIGLTILAHEMLHLFSSPGGTGSVGATLGLHPRKLLCYASSTARMGWSRAVVVLLTPLIVLTALPLSLQLVVGLPSGWFGLVAVANASISANDLIVAVYVYTYVPRSAADVQPEITGIRYLPSDVADRETCGT